MTIEDDVQQIMDLWHSIEDHKWDLANIWLDKEEGKLEHIEAKVEELEAKVILLLKIIKESKANIAELHMHKRHLLRLLHHVQPTREWQREIKEELDEIAREVKSAKEKARAIVLARMEARRHAAAASQKTVEPTSHEQLPEVNMEELSDKALKVGITLDNGLKAIPTENPKGFYIVYFDYSSGDVGDIVFACYPDIPREILGWPFSSLASVFKIVQPAWTSTDLQNKKARNILTGRLIKGKVVATEAYRQLKRQEEENKQRLQEMIPPQKSMQDIIRETDRNTWVHMQVGDMFAIPIPPQNPKAYYVIPNPNTLHILRTERLTKFYPDMDYKDIRERYVIEKAAWISAEQISNFQFHVDLILPTWTAGGEIGIARKIR